MKGIYNNKPCRLVFLSVYNTHSRIFGRRGHLCVITLRHFLAWGEKTSHFSNNLCLLSRREEIAKIIDVLRTVLVVAMSFCYRVKSDVLYVTDDSSSIDHVLVLCIETYLKRHGICALFILFNSVKRDGELICLPFEYFLVILTIFIHRH